MTSVLGVGERAASRDRRCLGVTLRQLIEIHSNAIEEMGAARLALGVGAAAVAARLLEIEPHVLNDQVSDRKRTLEALLERREQVRSAIEAGEVAVQIGHLEESLGQLLDVRGNLEATVDTVLELKKRIDEVQSRIVAGDVVIRAAQDGLARVYRQLHSTLSNRFHLAVHVDGGTLSIASQSRLDDILKSLTKLGTTAFNSVIVRLGAALRDDVIKPIIYVRDATLSLVEKDDSASMAVIIPSSESKSEESINSKPSNPAPLGAAVDKLSRVLDFVLCRVFRGHVDKMAALGHVLWRSLSRAIIAQCIEIAALPRSIDQVPAVRVSLLPVATSFERRLIESGFATSTPLTAYISALETKFIQKICRDAVLGARELLVNYSFTLSPANEFAKDDWQSIVENEFFTKHMVSSQITTTARQFISLFHGILAEAKQTNASARQQLLGALGEVAAAFLAIVPVRFVNWSSEPTKYCILFANDCFYISHHLAAISRLFKCPLLAGHLVPIRLVGCRMVDANIERHKAYFDSMLESFHEFKSIDSKRMYDKIFLDVAEFVRRLQETLQDCKEVTSDLVASSLVLRQLEAFMRITTSWVISRNDIPMESANRIFATLSLVTDFSRNAFPNALSESTESHSRAFHRFYALIDILHPDQSLFNLTNEVKTPKYDCIESEEFTTLICSLYQESEKRDRLLLVISSRY